MKILKHIYTQPFIVATAFAALIHSTWSLGTLFAGQQPVAGVNVEFMGWLTPALLIAFSLDIGQVVTSAEIRAGQRTKAKYATFTIFAGATFLLQFLYLIHHVPALDLAPGVSETWRGIATVIRDASIWFIPALLPLSTTLYTFSHEKATVTELTAPVKIERVETVTELATVEAPAVKKSRKATKREVTVKPDFLAELPTPAATQNGNGHHAQGGV